MYYFSIKRINFTSDSEFDHENEGYHPQSEMRYHMKKACMAGIFSVSACEGGNLAIQIALLKNSCARC